MFTKFAAGATLAAVAVASAAVGSPSATAVGAAAAPATSAAAAPDAVVPDAATPDAVVGVSNPSASSVLSSMTLRQRVGQLFMVSAPATGYGTGTKNAIKTYHVGNVYLSGRSSDGLTATRSLTDSVQRMSTVPRTNNVTMLVATDQEGGAVQVLSGPGISTIPSALTQGTWSSSTVRSSASTWAAQLRGSGVNLDLAPVLDVVTAAWAPYNQPIGYYHREFGHTSAVVTSKGLAFMHGLQDGRVGSTVKHFPTLGRVRYNTDTHSGVTDSTTTVSSAYLDPFEAAIDSGTNAVMMSSATYTKIDSQHPAAFSTTIITGLLRHTLGYNGLVISDDLGNAAQVQAWSPGRRATNFLSAGGDIVLTGNTSTLPAMVDAVVAKASSDPTFRAQVDASALRVLQAKRDLGLLQKYDRLSVTGSMNASTASALQVYLRTTQTGSWDANTRMALQRVIGVPIDGVWGSQSQAALQRFLGISRDGSSTLNARTVTALQNYLNNQR